MSTLPGLKTGGIGTNIKGSKIGGHHHEKRIDKNPGIGASLQIQQGAISSSSWTDGNLFNHIRRIRADDEH